MVNTHNIMPALGAKAPAFYLKNINGNSKLSSNDCKGTKGTLIIFMCNHCPQVLHFTDELVRIANDYRVQGIGITAINSNSLIDTLNESPELMAEFAFTHKMDFPYLFDETQSTAKAYGAGCTPDFYLFDTQDKLVYHGRPDDSEPGNNIPVSGTYIRTAIDGILYNRTINENQKPAVGCSITWI